MTLSTIIAAASTLLIKGKDSFFFNVSIIVILFVSTPKPAPLSFNELRTIKSRFLVWIFLMRFLPRFESPKQSQLKSDFLLLTLLEFLECLPS